MLFLLFLGSLAGCISGNKLTASPYPSATHQATPTPEILPDLSLGNIRLEITPEELCESDLGTYRILIEIVNQGEKDANLFAVSINNQPLMNVRALAAGETHELWIISPDLDISIYIDSLAQVSESNERNNRFTTSLSLPNKQAVCGSFTGEDSPFLDPLFTLDGHTGKVLSLAFSPDGNLVASGSTDNTLRLWRVVQGSLLRTMRGHPFPVLAVDFSPDGTILVTGSTDGLVRLWRVSDGRLLKELSGHAGRVIHLDFSADGRFFVSAGDDFTVRIWRMLDYRQVQTIDEGMSEITDLSFSPDSQSIAWSEINGTVRIRSLSGNWLHIFKDTLLAAKAITFDTSGDRLIVGYADGSIRLWDTETGKTIQVLKSHTLPITAIDFSPNGEWLASAYKDGTIHVWYRQENLFSTTPNFVLQGHTDEINSLCFSPSNTTLASGSDDDTIRIYQIPLD